RSFPPCGGRTGRGVGRRHRAGGTPTPTLPCKGGGPTLPCKGGGGSNERRRMKAADVARLAAEAASVQFVNGRVVDGLGNPPIEDGFVACAGGRIVAVGPIATRPRPEEGTAILDLEGRTIMPGLIDCHAHLVYSGFRSLEEVDRCPVETAAINAVVNAKKVLEAGYTTIRDVGTIANVAVAVRDAVA